MIPTSPKRHCPYIFTETWSPVTSMSHRRTDVVMSNVDDTLAVFGGYQVEKNGFSFQVHWNIKFIWYNLDFKQ